MIPRSTLPVMGAAFAVAACAQPSAPLEIRSRGAPGSAVAKPLPQRIAEAHGHLALGNVALAIEAYRKALRDDPESLDALRGLASCYDRMGRHDLARRYNEQALALAPNSPDLLGAMATTLERQGEQSQAASVRQELAKNVTIAPAAPAPTVRPITSALLQELLNSSPQLAGGAAPQDPAGALRLERLSIGEVALTTNEKPRWASQIVRRTAQSTTVRFVPLRAAAAADASRLRLLNAARRPGLAQTARRLLADQGWRRIAVGDAGTVRQASLILYPPRRRETAERLATQFGFPMRERAAGGDIIMLLGRDAVAALRSEQRG